MEYGGWIRHNGSFRGVSVYPCVVALMRVCVLGYLYLVTNCQSNDMLAVMVLLARRQRFGGSQDPCVGMPGPGDR
jgi:hypothetical protein